MHPVTSLQWERADEANGPPLASEVAHPATPRDQVELFGCRIDRVRPISPQGSTQDTTAPA